MTSVEVGDANQFNEIRLKLSTDLGREISEQEFIDVILQFGASHYDKLLHVLKMKDDDKSITKEQLDRLFSNVIKNVKETNLSQIIDETLYGV